MGFRFQKRIKIAPGITINLSKSGVSASVGVRGARKTFGLGKTRTTVGIPGTGVNYTSVSSSPPTDSIGASIGSGLAVALIAVILFFLWIFF